MKHILAVPMLATLVFQAHADELGCTMKRSYDDGAWTAVEATLNREADHIVGLVIYSTVASGKEGGGYVCAIDTAIEGQDVDWSRSDGATVLTIKHDPTVAEDTSVVTIEMLGGRYRVDLERASPSACGFGAEWPGAIVLEAGRDECQVETAGG